MRLTRQLFARGKLTIPAHIREELELKDGDLVELDIRRVREDAE
ncbi:AbrB/MazE/SpoVT family DNA-binding domain-containing protein [Haladaptatus sp. DFWS20]